ncbi:MAG: VCBS repeat-containing protein [Methanosarcinales archaeon]|nr:VCBS repeat-containing protein [Methanosarcinales archaeon]
MRPNKIIFVIIFFIVIIALAVYLNSSIDHKIEYDENVSITWTHLSSENGDIPPPGPSIEQTASLILDVDMDGINDFIIGSRKKGPSLLWFKKDPVGWTKYLIETETLPIEAGGAFHDIDGDGDLDVVFGGDWRSNKVWWWENPYPQYDLDKTWVRREIKNSGDNMHHDKIFGDFDGDGEIELVFWNQYANKLFIADLPSNPKDGKLWHYNEIWSSDSRTEGLAIGDMDGDKKTEIFGGGRWFKHISETDYIAYLIDDTQKESRIAVGDLKMGGFPEVVMVPGDGVGRLKWYECTGDPTEPSCWEGHDLLGFDVDHGHSLDVVDINGDGMLDIFVGEMRLDGDNNDAKMWIFWGDGNGNFREEIIATGYDNHESRVGDLDGDGDIDIIGKPYNWNTPGLNIWLNDDVAGLSLGLWERHIIDINKPWRSIFIASADMDNDGYEDIITGGWWYKNPKIQGTNWTRHTIGQTLNNMATVYDFDGDGDIDVLGTLGKGSDTNAVFVWGRNDGSGNFTIINNIEPGDGDFLQGVAVGNFHSGGPVEIALSWHEEGKGIQMLTVPSDPSNDMWSLRRISTISQDEALSRGDIDRDGNIDLLLGTKWLKNDGGSWTPYTINTDSGSPDRNKLADINSDGRLDAVVGFEAISKPGKLVWYEQGDKVTSMWTEHIIANVVGPMSLDVTDIDNDGDLDVVVGEHNLKNPYDAKLYLFENSDGQGITWNEQVIYTGDEHHDGAQIVDIDNDGDIDIISIGWSHGYVLLYENRAIKSSVKI